MKIQSWLDSTHTLIVRIPKPGTYLVDADGTVTELVEDGLSEVNELLDTFEDAEDRRA